MRRLDPVVLKGRITKSLYGENCKGNELTYYLIVTPNQAKGSLAESPFLSQASQEIKADIGFLNSPQQVARHFACAAYNLLSCVVTNTQVKLNLFTQYLFGGNSGRSTWDHLVDCTSEEVYKFSVYTNFNIVSLKRIEQKIAEHNDQDPIHQKHKDA